MKGLVILIGRRQRRRNRNAIGIDQESINELSNQDGFHISIENLHLRFTENEPLSRDILSRL